MSLRHPSKTLVILAAIAVCGLLLAAYSSYAFYRLRPERIQRELLGRSLTADVSLSAFDPSMTGFGDAIFKWDFTLDSRQASALTRQCREWDRGRCILAHRDNRRDTDLVVSLRGTTLRVEEWWY